MISELGFAEPNFADVINEKCEQIHNEAKAKGWWDEGRNFGELIALCHSELSEALEADRSGDKDKHLPEIDAVTLELADVFIRIADICGAYELDIGGAIEAKLIYNRTRPVRHGKKY